MIARILARRVSSRGLQTSACRMNLVQNLYLNEIKNFKPKPLTEKDAEGSVISWSAPSAAKPPSVEGDVSEVDAYAAEPVEVDAKPAASSAPEAPVGDDWFPIEDPAEEAH